MTISGHVRESYEDGYNRPELDREDEVPGDVSPRGRSLRSRHCGFHPGRREADRGLPFVRPEQRDRIGVLRTVSCMYQ